MLSATDVAFTTAVSLDSTQQERLADVLEAMSANAGRQVDASELSPEQQQYVKTGQIVHQQAPSAFRWDQFVQDTRGEAMPPAGATATATPVRVASPRPVSRVVWYVLLGAFALGVLYLAKRKGKA